MKKYLFALVLFSLLLIPLISAIDAEEIAEGVGIDTDKIPKSTQQIENDYLTKEWTSLIGETKILDPIHKFMISINPFFQIVFGHPYEISLTFLIILILWIFLFVKIKQISSALGMKESFSYITGAIIAIIFAQLILARLAGGIISLILAPENWWMRVLISVFSIVGLIATNVIIKLIKKNLEMGKKARKEREVDNNIEKMKTLTKSITNSDS